jgi:hypothetical protein
MKLKNNYHVFIDVITSISLKERKEHRLKSVQAIDTNMESDS